MKATETKSWRDKVSADCIRQLEYYRLVNGSKGIAGGALSDLLDLVSSGGIEKLMKLVNDDSKLSRAKPEDYEEVELSEELIKFTNSLGLGPPWNKVTPGVRRMPPNGARIVREFQSTLLLFEDTPMLRALSYLIIPVLGDFFHDKIREISRKSNVPDSASITAAYQAGELHTIFNAIGRVPEIAGRSLQGKSTPKGKADFNKADLIDLIRRNQKEKLSWEEIRGALLFAGIHFQDAEALRIFAHRSGNQRKKETPRNYRKTSSRKSNSSG